MKMKCVVLLYLSLTAIFYKNINAAMSEAQLKATVKLVRNLCQSKTKATDEDIEKMHQGDWNIDRTAMCYMQCALSRNRLVTKENTLDYDYVLNLAKKNLPEARKIGTIESVDKCKNSAKTLNDECVAAYEISKCFYESNPSNYFLP